MRWRDAWDIPTSSKLRTFGWLLAIALLIAMAARVMRASVLSSSAIAMLIVLGAAVPIVSLIAIYRPGWLAPIYRSWMIAVFPMGFIIHWGLWLVVFWCLVVPLGVVQRFLGRDRLRQADKDSATLWKPDAQPRAARHFWRQY